MIEAYLVTIVGVALAQASPGPNMLAVAGAALGVGRSSALWTVAGVATGMLVWAALVAFGLGMVLALYPTLLSGMKLLGGAYLLWLAVKGVRAAWAGGAPSVRADARPRTPLAAWRRGLAVVLTNPKALLLWSAVGTYLFGSGLDPWQVAGFGPLGAASALAIYGAYAVAFSTGAASRAYARFTRPIEAFMGAAFGALGGRLIVDGVRELRA